MYNNQTENLCECIFVNDGSSDNNEGILHEFQDRNSRIVIINQQNQGVGAARNNRIDCESAFIFFRYLLFKRQVAKVVNILNFNNNDTCFSNYTDFQCRKIP
jgi:glycosyltransferase involved in cell wall biosynthesis